MQLKLLHNLTTGLGLASNTYKKVIESGEITLKELICEAAERGLSWVEVRDAHVTMSEGQLMEIKTLAEEKNIRIHYAWDNADVFEIDSIFLKGIQNARIFGKGTCCRVVVAPQSVSGKKGYTLQEFKKIIETIKIYVEKAKKADIVLCFENSMEPVRGDGKTYFGMSEILETVPEMQSTFDAANFTAFTTQINPSEKELFDYYKQYHNQIHYFHLKMTKNHQLSDDLVEDGDFDVNALMEMFAQIDKNMMICLEIPQQDTLEKMNQAVESSLRFLQRHAE